MIWKLLAARGMLRYPRALLKAQKIIPWLIILAGLVAYYDSLDGGFIYDDLPRIVDNLRIRHLWPAGETVAHSSRPVVQMSLAVNYALGGLNPRGYHAFNLAIHILAGLILYGVLRRTLLAGTGKTKWGEAAPWLAGAVSLIWLVHPLQTESVTYTIQRAESLMGLFYLLTLYCVIRSAVAVRSGWWKAGAVASCALGMATKPVMVTAPIVMLLYDRAFLANSWREVLRQRRWVYLGLAATWLLLPVLLASAPSEWKETAGFGFKTIPVLNYAMTQPSAVLHYLRLAFWPDRLCFDYGSDYGWPMARTIGQAWPGLIAVGILLTATIGAWRRNPALGFAGVWFLLILAPTSGFVPVADLVVEHRMYLPLAGVVALVVVGAFTLGKRVLRQRQSIVVGCSVCGLLVVLLIFLTIQRNRDYSSDLTIWRDTVAKCMNNPRAHNGLGFALEEQGREQDAVDQYVQALVIKPDYAQAHNNLGVALSRVGKMNEAVDECERALQIQPDFDQAHYNLGVILVRQGKLREAVQHFDEALRINPDYLHTQINLAWLLATQTPADGGDPVRALVLARRACAVADNRTAQSLDTLAIAYAANNMFSDAIATCQQAIALARAEGRMQLAAQIEKRLELYRAGRSFRLSVDSATSAHNP